MPCMSLVSPVWVNFVLFPLEWHKYTVAWKELAEEVIVLSDTSAELNIIPHCTKAMEWSNHKDLAWFSKLLAPHQSEISLCIPANWTNGIFSCWSALSVSLMVAIWSFITLSFDTCSEAFLEYLECNTACFQVTAAVIQYLLYINHVWSSVLLTGFINQQFNHRVHFCAHLPTIFNKVVPKEIVSRAILQYLLLPEEQGESKIIFWFWGRCIDLHIPTVFPRLSVNW